MNIKIYTLEEIKEHIENITKTTYGHGCWGEPESYPPTENDIKSAHIISQLLERK